MAASNSTDFAKETVQVLKDQWKCGVCENGPRPGKVSWYKCNAGHSICQDCYKETCQTEIKKATRKKAATICNAIVLENPCKLTEALLSMKSMRFMCVNESRGCEEILDKEAMIYHEPECIYRLVQLPCFYDYHTRSSRPMDAVPYHEVFDHMEKFHSGSYQSPCKLALNETAVEEVSVRY